MTKLSPRQYELLNVIKAFTRENGHPPTIRELMVPMMISSPTGIECHLKALEKKGRIKRESNAARTIVVVPDAELPKPRPSMNRKCASKTNRVCKSTGPRVVKPRKKPKQKESLQMVAYRKANRLCEITMHLPLRHPARARDWRRDSVHHIQWGQSSRIDIPTNLIRTTAKIHDWIHANADAGRIVSLYAKLRKGELNWDELDRIYTGNALRPMSYRDYVSTLEPREEWVRKLWQVLISPEQGVE